MISRRGFLGGLLAAPAIIKVAGIMPVKTWIEPVATSVNPIFSGAMGGYDGVHFAQVGEAWWLPLWSQELRKAVQEETVISRFISG